jgi:predicted nucleic acid-binding protein
LNADCFLDTNILVYAASGHVESPEKQRVAQGLLSSAFATSGQVLAEFYSVLTRKPAMPVTEARKIAQNWLHLLARKPCQPIDAPLVIAATQLAGRYQISYWDAAIVAAAERLGARTLYTEDLSHGQTYGTVTAINPFLDA